MEIADALARVCEHPDHYRRLLDHADQHLVDDLSRPDQPIVAALDRLHEALTVTGKTYGVYGGGQRGSDPLMIGLPGARRSEPVYLCPERQCSRALLRADVPGSAVPICSVFGKPMRERRLCSCSACWLTSRSG